MQYAEKAKEVQAWFAERGHTAIPSNRNELFIGLTDEEKEVLKLQQKAELDVLTEHWDNIQKSDVVLVLNYDKHGIKGYIGGNSFLEMGFAYILKKPIYLLNDIPEMPYYKTEIVAMKPTIIHNDLSTLTSPS
jgi:hypothetical protein